MIPHVVFIVPYDKCKPVNNPLKQYFHFILCHIIPQYRILFLLNSGSYFRNSEDVNISVNLKSDTTDN